MRPVMLRKKIFVRRRAAQNRRLPTAVAEFYPQNGVEPKMQRWRSKWTCKLGRGRPRMMLRAGAPG